MSAVESVCIEAICIKCNKPGVCENCKICSACASNVSAGSVGKTCVRCDYCMCHAYKNAKITTKMLSGCEVDIDVKLCIYCESDGKCSDGFDFKKKCACLVCKESAMKLSRFCLVCEFSCNGNVHALHSASKCNIGQKSPNGLLDTHQGALRNGEPVWILN